MTRTDKDGPTEQTWVDVARLRKPMGRPRGTAPPPRYTVRIMPLVSPDQRQWVEEEAERQGITLAALIRQWIDEKRAQ